MSTNQFRDDVIVTFRNTSHLKYDFAASINLGTAVAKFINVVKFINVAKSTPGET